MFRFAAHPQRKCTIFAVQSLLWQPARGNDKPLVKCWTAAIRITFIKGSKLQTDLEKQMHTSMS